MNNTTQKLKVWAINKIKTEYPDDVALLIAVEGFSVNGDEHGECFDYFVPTTDRGEELSQTVIIDGIGYDLYPQSWERTERTANLDDRGTLCLSNAKILYSRSSDDENRFLALRQKLFDNLADSEFIYKKALERLDVAMDLYRTMMFENALYKVRMAAGFVVDFLSEAVAYLNGTYRTDFGRYRFVFGKRQCEQSEVEDNSESYTQAKELPESFIEYSNAVINAKTADELKNLSHLLISVTRRFIAAHKPVQIQPIININFTDLANWYQELSLVWRRLRYFCETEDAPQAFAGACFLQSELMVVEEEFGLAEMDLLGCYHAANLTELKNQSIKFEKYIVDEIENHGVKINKYATVEDFLAQN